MTKFLYLTYDINSDKIKESLIPNPTPDQGFFFITYLLGTDPKGNKYNIISQGAGIDLDPNSINYYLNEIISVSKISDPINCIASTSFLTFNTKKDNRLVPNTYTSNNGSKLIVNNTNIRKLCIKL